MGCLQSTANDDKGSTQPAPVQVKAEAPVVKSSSIPISAAEFGQEDVKILILGAGECGKSTLWRQLKILHCGGFTNEERDAYRDIIRQTIVEDIQAIINELRSNNNAVAENAEASLEFITQVEANSVEFDDMLVQAISTVWHDPMVQVIYNSANSIGLGENTALFFERIQQFADDNYLPTDEEILKARIRTIGRAELKFKMDQTNTLLIDVGGQKTERKNWSKCFSGVHYILFVVSLSDFDQNMFEENNMRRSADSIQLFSSIVSQPFKNTSVFLILNKVDLFRQKLRENPQAFAETYPGYTGAPDDVDAAIEHVKNAFLGSVDSGLRTENVWIEVIPTCAMQNESVDGFIQTMARRILDERK